jgi:single-strand DNA-binding protein
MLRSEWAVGVRALYTVKAWRKLAEHCRDSLRRADPVMVHGRLSQRSYVKDGVERTVVEVTAVSIGHDLSLGTSAFRRTSARREEPRREEVTAGAAA